jgi:nitrogen regulatory protein PII
MYGAQEHEKIYRHTYRDGKFTPVRILNIAQQEESIDDVIAQLSKQQD